MSIPIYAVHHDPQHYPDPYRWDPDRYSFHYLTLYIQFNFRFAPDEKAKRSPLTFLPFGYGPRNCVGMRFAEFEIRSALVVLLRRFRFLPVDNSPVSRLCVL